jgi:predicted transcriptional regulator
MLVEVPDPQIVVDVIIAFFVGVFGMLIYNKIKLFTNQKGPDPSHISRMDYYERQLIDMKIRMDALDLEENSPIGTVLEKIESIMERKEEVVVNKEPEKQVQKPRMPNMGFNGVAEHVLGLITRKEMTSRDIQITIGRSREHTSRLMKRLFEEGLVERNTKMKPFTYKITEKGKTKLESPEQIITAQVN